MISDHLLRNSSERDAMQPKTYPKSTSVVMPWLCELCRAWTERGSYERGSCTRCGTPRPD